MNPFTKEHVVDAEVCHYALAVMTTAGLYETSGDWLYDNPAVCEVDEGGCVIQSFLSPT